MAGGGGAAQQAAQNMGQLLNQQGNMGNISSYGLGSLPPPNPGFMQYPQQGQPNQPTNVPLLSTQPPAVQNDGGPDGGAAYAGNSMGFDNSGSDAGVGGQPVDQVQTPFQQGTKPLNLAQFQQPQGLQIAGNPTSQVVQRPQLR